MSAKKIRYVQTQLNSKGLAIDDMGKDRYTKGFRLVKYVDWVDYQANTKSRKSKYQMVYVHPHIYEQISPILILTPLYTKALCLNCP